MLDQRTLQRITRRGVSEIIPEEEFISLLKEGKPLRLKMGFDPSRPDIHLGHVVGLRKLRQLQELGHKVILIVGDWTAQIGDPSGQSAIRPMLTHQEVIENADSYMKQFFRIVDRDRTEAVWQSEWFGKFSLADVIRLTSRFTVAQFLDRDDFAKRFRAHKPIAVTELLYPLLQAYDSVAINADVEFGGTDQKFNLLVGRELQGMMGQRPQQCFLMPILVGTDGVRKMSKSLDNYIGVEEHPNDMYGKVMSIQDELLMGYFEYLTDVADEDLEEMGRALQGESVNPMELKKRLAREITEQFHGPIEAKKAEEYFENVVQGAGIPNDIPVLKLTSTQANVITLDDPGQSLETSGYGQVSKILVKAGLASSNSESKRLINDKAVSVIKVNGEVKRLAADDLAMDLETGDIIKVGNRKFVRIIRDVGS